MIAKTGVLLLTALVAAGPLASRAQPPSQGDSHPAQDSHQAQKDAEIQREAAKEGRANDRNGNDPSLNDDQSPRRDDAHGGDDRITELHRTHPRAAARCHDGFFTMTRDRGRACTRHGGIDVWLRGQN